MGPTSAVSRRKQAKPQRVDRRELVVGVVDVPHLQPPLDCHVCGHCSNEFFDVADFIAHKKVCQVVPVLNGHQKPVTPPSSDTEGAPIDLSKKNNTPDKINVLRLETTLDPFRHQQMLERLYSQVASNSEDPTANTSYLLSPPSSNEANADKAHQCHANGCQQTCASRGALLWHTVGRHAAQRLLQCDRCGQRFGDNVQMQRHKNDCDRPPRPLSRCARSPLDPDESRSSVPTSIHQDFSVLKKCGEHETHMSTGWSTTPPSSVATPALSSLAFLAAGLIKEAPLDLTLSAAAAAAASFPSFVGQIPSFATAPASATSPSSEPNDSYPTLLGNEDDWESLMEVSNTDEAEKIRQLVGDKALPTTDPNQCLLCRRILSCKSALQMHYRTHTGERPFKCKICQRAFTTKGNLKTHMGVHRAKHPFRNGTTAIQHQCPICQKRFFTAPLLQQHISQHTDQLTKNGMAHAVVGGLTNGSSRLESESSVNGHNESAAIDMVHDNVPQQLMPTLPLPAPAVTTPTTPAASVATQLMHPVIPTSEGNGCMQLSPGFPFPHFFAGMPGLPPNFGIPSNQQQLPILPTSTTCNICFKIFACNSALEIHYRSHTKDRPFKCDECGRGFSTKGNMKQHLLTHKIREMPSSTTEDSSDEGNNNNNNTIMAALGIFKQEQAETADFEERMNSNIERQTIRPKSAFTNPDKPLVPPVEPQKQEPSPLESIQKMWAQTEPPPPRQTPVLSKHQCGVCFKHFSSSSALQIHMRTHTGDKPFKCNVCTRAFTTRGNLKVHMGTHVWQNPSRRGRRIFDFATNVGGQSSASDGGYPDISSPVSSSAGSGSAQMDNSSTPSVPITFTSTTPPAFGGGLRPMGPMSFGLMPPPPIVSSASAAGSMEALMWNMWRTVCSVCQKVCSTPAELEEHLKMHIPTLFRQ